MTITIEAIYEAGVLKLLQPIPSLKEQEKVRVTVETESIIDKQRRGRIVLPEEDLREIIENPDYSILNI